MTEQERNLIIKLWENGTPINSIIHMLDCKQCTAKQYIKELKESGILKKENRKRRSVDIIINVFNKGETNPYQISEITGYSVNTVRTVLHNAHIPIPKSKRKRSPTDVNTLCQLTQTIIREIESGEPCSEIAKYYNVSRAYVYKVKQKYVKEQKK